MPGLKPALLLGAGAMVVLSLLRPPWALGVLVGLGAVGLARLLHARLLGLALAEGKRAAFVAAGLGRFGLLAGVAVLGVRWGADPLGVALGLALFPLGLWLELGLYVLRNR